MDKGTLVRTVLLFVAWLNTFLVSRGYDTLPVISEESVALLVSFGASLWAWWKNNYITSKGKAQKSALNRQNL